MNLLSHASQNPILMNSYIDEVAIPPLAESYIEEIAIPPLAESYIDEIAIPPLAEMGGFLVMSIW